jgi:hypothetical protein
MAINNHGKCDSRTSHDICDVSGRLLRTDLHGLVDVWKKYFHV